MTQNNDSEKRDYQVGYKKPPMGTRFKPGSSGNPKGRPRGSKNFATILNAELSAAISLKENGKWRKVSKREAIVKQLINKGASGDLKAISMLIKEIHLIPPSQTGAPTAFSKELQRLSAEHQIREHNKFIQKIIDSSPPE